MNPKLPNYLRTVNTLIALILLALCLSACSALTNSSQGQVVSQFMTAMLNRDVTAAVALFPAGSEAEIQPQLEVMLADQYYLFDGYQSITVTSLNTSLAEGQSTTELEGQVTYTGEITGTFQASLFKEGETWKLTNINLNVPEEKVP